MKKPKFNKPLHVGSPNVGDRAKFHQYVDEIFDRGWLTNRGPLIQELEKRICDYLGVKHCITTCNGTKALEIAARALEFKDEVIIPSLTFVATAHALQWQEIKPVFCDVERQSYNIDPSEIERHITPKTTGIIGVNLYGRPCNIESLQELAEKHNLKLMFDSAHAFGCTNKGQMIGNFGDCEVFSFHATKLFNTFEGGAIVTNNDELASKIRLMLNFGFKGMDKVIYIGTNGKMNEISAAMGLTNLDSLDSIIANNKRNYECYRDRLEEITGLSVMKFSESEKCNWQYVVVEVDEKYSIGRDELMEKLHAENVLVRRYFWPACHKMEPYRSLQPIANLMLPVTEALANRILVFPTGMAVGLNDIKKLLRLL